MSLGSNTNDFDAFWGQTAAEGSGGVVEQSTVEGSEDADKTSGSADHGGLCYRQETEDIRILRPDEECLHDKSITTPYADTPSSDESSSYVGSEGIQPERNSHHGDFLEGFSSTASSTNGSANDVLRKNTACSSIHSEGGDGGALYGIFSDCLLALEHHDGGGKAFSMDDIVWDGTDLANNVQQAPLPLENNDSLTPVRRRLMQRL